MLHTDVTQVQLGYISAVTDEANREDLAAIVSSSPNKTMIKATLNEV
ncbi:hypothetical protein [Liquorilactobacillus vini]|nr:hypothetical protein [Liquorilactobacillus vini]